MAVPPHRVFAVFDNLPAGERAIRQLRAEGLAVGDDDVWVFLGQDGIRRLDVSGHGHGAGAGMVRLAQRLMSSDVDYLHTLEAALRQGGMVVAVVAGHGNRERIADVLHARGGHSLARVAHWNFVPA